MPSRIEDYALIGDCRGAALVSNGGSIDWLCVPRFDADAVLAALLGDEDNGFWRIAPADGVKVLRVTRRYRPGTLTLETEMETDEGVVMLVVFMTIHDECPDVHRIVVGKSGAVRMHMELAIRCAFGRSIPWVRHTDEGIVAIAGPDLLSVATPAKLVGKDLRTVSDFTVKKGERVPFSMTWSPSHLEPPPVLDSEDALVQCDAFWERWSSQIALDGPYAIIIRRSLITLKALTYAPTGGIVAAPTTSLPEKIGGVRNWDYRFCWLRDATFTLYALMNAGFQNEASAWRDWLLRAAAGAPSQLQILYGIAGERRLTEVELPWLAGYEQSRPVRVGNLASEQLQLDVYGEVISSLYLAREAGLTESEPSWALQRALVRHLENAWKWPDFGIWEVRGPARHFTHSKVMCWVAFDRAVKSSERWGLDAPLDRWRAVRDEIHADIVANAWDAELGSFVQYYGSRDPDASLLLMLQVGFLPPEDERMIGTVAAIQKHLVKDGLVIRYPTRPEVDGLPADEGAFLACSFWLADALVLLGRTDEARALFERLLGLCNDLGLLAEEVDVRTGRQVGNFPQALSHVALVNTAVNLTRAIGPAKHRQAS
jgi:GH15 family glucan-1,4-alpha-glucosidase